MVLAEAPVLHERNRRVHELRAQNWSLRAIASETGISHPRVAQILAAQPANAEDRLRAEERSVALELRHLEDAVAGHRGRIRRLRTRLRIIEEELEEADIRRLLGL